jgi:tetratricopeptide (TPR) repeat protein
LAVVDISCLHVLDENGGTLNMRHQVTHYDTLGVKPDASESEIRAAFRELTRKYHPDRFAGDEQNRAEERFQAITEAFNVLNRPESRENYDKGLSMAIGSPSTSGGTDPKEFARRLAAKGAEELRAGQLAEAIEHLKMATDHDDDNSRAHYFYGLALGRARGKERDALRHLERAAALEPNNAVFKAEAGVLCLAVGMTSRAARFAQEATELDPTNKKALAVLAKLDETEGSGGQGLLGRLRRKG